MDKPFPLLRAASLRGFSVHFFFKADSFTLKAFHFFFFKHLLIEMLILNAFVSIHDSPLYLNPTLTFTLI